MNKKVEDRDQEGRNIAIASTVGVGAGGAGMIDLRKKTNVNKVKRLGSSWDSLKKHVKPGDVLIGAPAFGHEAVLEEHKAFKDNFKNAKSDYANYKKGLPTSSFNKSHFEKLERKIPKKLHGQIPRLTAIKSVAWGTVGSKFADPNWSHSEMFATKTKSGWAGGFMSSGNSVVPANSREAAKLSKSGTSNHYVLMRPVDGNSNLITKTYNKSGSKASINKMKSSMGRYNLDYDFVGGVKATIKDTLLPKLNPNEKLKSKAQIACDSKVKGGICSTFGARFSTKTVGGKATKDVLPKDYLRSSNWKAIGRVGDVNKTPLRWRIALGAPKMALRAGVGLGAGLAVNYGLNKLTQPKMDMAKTAELLLKIAKSKPKSKFKILKDNKVPLTPDERAEVMSRKAVWNFSGKGPTPAVWKSVNEKSGEITYITNTHRAYNTAPTLKGAIGRYHKFIKGTA
jgi:hypothetical protein